MATSKAARVCALSAVAVLVGVGVSVGTGVAAQGLRVDGHYQIVSTDCYFAAGACEATFDIEQTGAWLWSPHDRYFHGHVVGQNLTFGEIYPPGTSEDGWQATGATTDGRIVTGTMQDGLGGSGEFVMTYVGP